MTGSMTKSKRSRKQNQPGQWIKDILRSGSKSELLKVLRENLESGPFMHYWNRARQWQVWIALALGSYLAMWLGFRFGDRFGLLMGFFLAVGLCALVVFYDDWRLDTHFAGLDLEGTDPYGVIETTRKLAHTLHLPLPHLRLVENLTPFVFSAGLTRRRLRIFLSSAALKRLEPEELKAVLAYQLMRFHTAQTRVATATAALSDLLFVISGAFDAALFLRIFLPLFTGRSPRRSCPGPFTWAMLPFATMFLRLVIHRKSISAVDHLTANRFGCTENLARALVKLDSYGKTLPLDVNAAEASLFTVDPLASSNWSKWTSVQPPIQERVLALAGRYPL